MDIIYELKKIIKEDEKQPEWILDYDLKRLFEQYDEETISSACEVCDEKCLGKDNCVVLNDIRDVLNNY